MPGGSVNLGHVVGPTGPQGATGPTGPQGIQGPVGPGVPAGGNANEVLRKASGTNYDTEWHKLTGEDIPVSASDASSLSQQIDDLGPYNGLDSDSTIAALSAAQGKVLNQQITPISKTVTQIMSGEVVRPLTLNKIGRLCVMSGLIYMSADITGDFDIAQIPDDCKPSVNIQAPQAMVYGGNVEAGGITLSSTTGLLRTALGYGVHNRQYINLYMIWVSAN